MILKFNIIKSLLEVSFLDKLWKALISEEAIVAYLISLFALMPLSTVIIKSYHFSIISLIAFILIP